MSSIWMYLKEGEGGRKAATQAGLSVQDATGKRAYVSLPSLTWIAPPEVAGFEVRFSMYEHLVYHGAPPDRELGIYYEASARGSFKLGSCGKDTYLALAIEADTLEDLRTMYEKMIGGTIRPTHSLSAPQAGLSREELEAELREKNAQVKWLCGRIDAMRQLAEKLEAPCWRKGKRDREIIAKLRRLAGSLAVSDETLQNHLGIKAE